MQPGMSSDDLRAILSRYESWAAKQPGDGNGNGHKNGNRAEEVREIPYEEAIRQYRTRRARSAPKATPLSGVDADADSVSLNLRSMVEANTSVEANPEVIDEKLPAKDARGASTTKADSADPCGEVVPDQLGQHAFNPGRTGAMVGKAKTQRVSRTATATSMAVQNAVLGPGILQEDSAPDEARITAQAPILADAPKRETKIQGRPAKKLNAGPAVPAVPRPETVSKSAATPTELACGIEAVVPHPEKIVKSEPPVCVQQEVVAAPVASPASGSVKRMVSAATKAPPAKQPEFRQVLAKSVRQAKRSVPLNKRAAAERRKMSAPAANKGIPAAGKMKSVTTLKAAASVNKKAAGSSDRKAALGTNKKAGAGSIKKAMAATSKRVEPDRDRRITTRFSATEQRRIEKHAVDRGLTVSAYLRQCALSGGMKQTAAPKTVQGPKPRSRKRSGDARQVSSQPTLFVQPEQSGLGGWLTLLRRRFLSSPMRFSEQA